MAINSKAEKYCRFRDWTSSWTLCREEEWESGTNEETGSWSIERIMEQVCREEGVMLRRREPKEAK